jgi:2-dehydropantoate 2-reductase
VPFDLILLACKAYDLTSAIEAVTPAAGPLTMVLPLLNGIAHLETLDRAFERKRVLGGVAHLSVTRQADGSIAHLNDYHRLIVGARSRIGDDALIRLAGLFERVGVDCRISDDIEQELWEKLVFIATLAGATCILRTSVGGILGTHAGPGLVADLLAECQAIATAAGHPPTQERLAAYRAQLLEPGSSLKSSMLRDIEDGKRTEGEHILGDMVRHGERLGVSTPLLAICRSCVEAWDAAN